MEDKMEIDIVDLTKSMALPRTPVAGTAFCKLLCQGTIEAVHALLDEAKAYDQFGVVLPLGTFRLHGHVLRALEVFPEDGGEEEEEEEDDGYETASTDSLSAPED